MDKLPVSLFKKPVIGIFLALPFISFLVLRLFPVLDIHAWNLSWYTRLLQYYSSAFASFMALIAGLFTNDAVKGKNSWRAFLVSFGFLAISAFFILSSINTPTVLVDDWYNPIFYLSLRIGLPLGFLFFSLATFDFPLVYRQALIARRKWIYLFSGIIFLAFILYSYLRINSLFSLLRLEPYFSYGLAVLTTVLVVRITGQIQKRHWFENPTTEGQLVIAMILLAEAQIFISFGSVGQLSWLLYHPTLLLGLTMAILAILYTFRAARDVQITRYFAVLGSILIVGLSLISIEFGFRILSSDTTISRTALTPLMTGQAFLSFILLYVIVLHLGRIITERATALKREQRARVELTQLIVHDLKSPLTVILSGMNLLNKESLGELNETQKRLLVNLEQSGQNILQMINDLLDVERFESGVFQLQKRLTNIEQLLEGRLADLRIVAGQREQQLVLHIESLIPEMRMDKGIMQRVLDNLLGNAIKFTPETGKIQVRALTHDEELFIYVADSGPGIPSAEREYIFEKFGQVRGSERRGAGLGLTFCKMAVEAHGGSILAMDSPLGGAMFEIRIPVEMPDEGVVVDEELDVNQLSVVQSS